MKKSRHIYLFIIILLFLAACAPTAGNQEESSIDDLNPKPAAETADPEVKVEENPTGIKLTDASGNELNLQSPPERVVIAGRASQMIIHAAYLFPEAVERVVGMEQRAQRKNSMLPLIDPDFEDKTQFERDAAAEQIAPLQPDAVLMKTYMAERLGEPLGQLDIPVIYMDLETPKQFLRDVGSLGDLFDNPERAEQIESFYKDRMQRVESALQGLKPEEQPGVLLLQYDSRSGDAAFNVPPASWLQTQMVELAGGIPVWLEASEAGGWTVVNFEQIAAWDPDMIFVVNYFDDPDPVVADLRQDPKWAALRAVQTEKIFAFPGDFSSWDQPDTRWILGLQWLAAAIHPEEFESLDLLNEVKTFYEELYRMDAGTFEEQVLPLVTGDFDL